MFNGMLAVCKGKGLTSHDVIYKLRHITGQKKMGHTGTLDPMAEGVLPVCMGNGTRLTEIFVNDDKQYRAVLRLGVTTDTQDMTGEVLSETDELPDETRIRETVASFKGEQLQLPPMYSAVKIKGRRLYEYARAGVEIERKPRKVNVTGIVTEDISLPFVTVLVDCSKGTYIRTICRDIGEKLGCGAALEKLVRTRSGVFRLEDCLTIDQVQEVFLAGKLDEYVRPVDSFYPGTGKAVIVPDAFKLLMNGNPLEKADLSSEEPGGSEPLRFRVYDMDGVFRGIYSRKRPGGIMRPEKMYL